MTDKTKLREALEDYDNPEEGAMPDQLDTIAEAAQTLLSLMEKHDIQALIDGKAEIKPKPEECGCSTTGYWPKPIITICAKHMGEIHGKRTHCTCGEKLANMEGVGPFCPSKQCDICDGPWVEGGRTESVIKLHAGDQRAARLLDALEEIIMEKGAGIPMPTIIGICELLKDIVKGMNHHE